MSFGFIENIALPAAESWNHSDTVTQSNTVRKYLPLSEREIFLSKQVMDIAFALHKTLGPGLLERVYSKCFIYELEKRNLRFLKQQNVPIVYDGQLIMDGGLRLDLLIDNLIIVEFKAQENFHPVWEAQLLSYLKLAKKRLGYILNFHVPLMKDGIKRMIL